MTLGEKQSELIELFNSLEAWPDRFQFLIDTGTGLPELPVHLRGPATQIMSCSSRTFFLATESTGIITIQGWSNASIPSGLIAIVRNIFDGGQLSELRSMEIDFHLKTDLINNLTEQRKAGLQEMINRVIRL